MVLQALKTLEITRVTDQQRQRRQDVVIVEEPLEIWAQVVGTDPQQAPQQLITTMRTPGDDEALTTGWLLSMGVARHKIHSMRHTGNTAIKGQATNRMLVTLTDTTSEALLPLMRTTMTVSSCGVCGEQQIERLLDVLPPLSADTELAMPRTSIHALTATLIDKGTWFSQTGGNHSAMLFDDMGQCVDVKEDVGRHNALDKLIGANAQRFPGRLGLVLSGRVSFEMVQKAAMQNITMIVALGAPTSLAVELCIERDICLLGFVKSQGYNLYSGERQLANY